jgi:hypothetical protein
MMHIEILNPALLQILYVSYILPQEDYIFFIISYILAIMTTVRIHTDSLHFSTFILYEAHIKQSFRT